jgi:hypothetical protein
MLLFVIVLASLIWMHFASATWSAGALEQALDASAQFRKCSRNPPKRTRRHAQADRRLASGRPRSGTRRARRSRAQSLDFDPVAAAVLRGLDGVVGCRRETAASASPSRPISCSGWPRCRAFPARRCASSILHGADFRRTALDDADDLVADDPGLGIGLPCRIPTPYWIIPAAGAAVRLRRRQFCVVDGEHQLLLPAIGEGQRARAECRPRQSWRQR